MADMLVKIRSRTAFFRVGFFTICLNVKSELQKICGYVGITREEGLVVEHTVSTNVKRTIESTSD